MSADSDIDTLRAALTRTAAYGLQPRREHRLGAPADGLAFVQAHIAATILGRQLVFLIDDAPRLECTVEGGRLLVVTSPGGQPDPALEHNFDDPSATEETAASLQSLRAAILSLCEGAAVIALRVRPAAQAGDSDHRGASAASVARAFGLASAPAAALAAFQGFVQAASGQVTAAAYLQDDMLHPLAGDEAGLDQLVTVLEEALAEDAGTQQGLGSVLSEDGMICWSHAGGTDGDVVAAALGGEMLFALARPASQAALARAWYRAQTGS